jgi:hypothetical protein
MWIIVHSNGTVETNEISQARPFGWKTLRNAAVPVPQHGRLIDADALRQKMYHEAFEMDSPMQKWDSGCWIRYKMFERMEETAPTIIQADPPKEEA